MYGCTMQSIWPAESVKKLVDSQHLPISLAKIVVDVWLKRERIYFENLESWRGLGRMS